MLLSEADSLSAAITVFLRYLRYRRAATPATIITYESILGQFQKFTGDIPPGELKLTHIDDYAESLALQGFKPKTFRNKLAVIKSFVKYLYAHHLTDIRPESVEVPPDKQPETIYLNRDETEQLLSAAKSNPRDYALLSVLSSSGMRVSEVCNLKTSDVFRRSVSIKFGKGGKHRVTFINKQAEAAVEAYKRLSDPTEYLFPNPNGRPLSRVVVARKVKYYAQKAGIKKNVKVHTLRHSFATQYLDAGGRIEDLQQMLGHSDLKTTMIYLHFTNEHLHGAYDKIMAG